MADGSTFFPWASPIPREARKSHRRHPPLRSGPRAGASSIASGLQIAIEAAVVAGSINTPTSRHHGAAKHGDALLAGLMRCRRCGRKLVLRYSGPADNIPRYYCSRGLASTGDARCIAFGGSLADKAIETVVLEAVEPGAIAAAIEAGTQEATQRDEVAEALRRDLEGTLWGRSCLSTV